MRASTATRDQQMVELYRSGTSMTALATQFKVSRQRVHQILRRCGAVTAQTARSVRRNIREEHRAGEVEAFLSQHQATITVLAASGAGRLDVEARFILLLPGIPAAVIGDAVASAGVLFDVNVQEFVFSPAVIESGVWYLLACDLQLPADPAIALKELDLVQGQEIAAALRQDELDPETVAMVLCRVAAARSYALQNPLVTLTKARFDSVRRQVLDDLGLTSAQGLAPWPPTSQTVMKRLGGGYWADALRGIGITPHTRGRSRGLVVFEEGEYDAAVVDFLAQSTATGQPATFEAYGEWVDSEDRAGRRRPSQGAVRLRYTSWINAKRMVIASGARSAPRITAHARPEVQPTSVGTIALHQAQTELARFRQEISGQRAGRVSAVAERFIKNYCQRFEYSRREWIRQTVFLDDQAIARRLASGSLSRAQRAALEQEPQDVMGALKDMYLDKMLSGPQGGPRNTDGWLRADAQVELDAMSDETVAKVKVLRETRNLLTHDSEEAKARLTQSIDALSSLDSGFNLRQATTRRVILIWLSGADGQRLRQLAEGIVATWRAMIVAESVLRTPS
jgi:hypothetical protein